MTSEEEGEEEQEEEEGEQEHEEVREVRQHQQQQAARSLVSIFPVTSASHEFPLLLVCSCSKHSSSECTMPPALPQVVN